MEHFSEVTGQPRGWSSGAESVERLAVELVATWAAKSLSEVTWARGLGQWRHKRGGGKGTFRRAWVMATQAAAHSRLETGLKNSSRCRTPKGRMICRRSTEPSFRRGSRTSFSHRSVGKGPEGCEGARAVCAPCAPLPWRRVDRGRWADRGMPARAHGTARTTEDRPMATGRWRQANSG